MSAVSSLPRSGAMHDTVHRFPVRVYYEDTDAAGIVYYANYLKFAERARTEMLRCLGVEQDRLRRDTGLSLVMRRSTIDYLASARLEDDLVIVTRLTANAGAAVEIEQEIRRGDVILVRIDSRVACVNETGRPTRLPPPLVAAIASVLRPKPMVVTADAR